MDGASEQNSSAQSTSFRSPPRYLIWMISSIVALIIAVTKELSVLALLFMLLAFYCIESLITEVFGVSVDDTGVTVQNRLLPNNPWIVFWRKRFKWKDIERICSLSDRRVQLISVNMRADATFGTRDEKLEFFGSIRISYARGPDIQHSRGCGEDRAG
jgi:hypothetical protein